MVKTVIHKLMVAGILLLSLASCVKSEIHDGGMSDVPMMFSTYASRSTSGTKADGSYVAPGTTVLPSDSSFGVMAYYQPGTIGSYTGIWADQATKLWKPDFMFNEEVTFDGTNYSYSPLRYWPANDENTVSFWAYYPYSAWAEDNSKSLKFFESDGTTRYTAASTTGLPVVKYTVASDPADQQDIMFDAFTKKNMTYASCDPVDGTVDLTFKHALALVEFQVVEGTGAEVSSFSVTNLYRSGTCSTLPAISWTGQGDKTDFSVASLSLSGSTTVCTLLIMPQTVRADAEVSITYDIHFASYDPDHPDDIIYAGNSGSALLSTAGITEWEAGKHYIYKISAGFERIEFESAVASDWSVGNDNISVN